MKKSNNVYLINASKFSCEFSQDFFLGLTNDILDELKYPFAVEVNIIVCSKDEIKKLNYKYRNIDKPTDVLSFPIESDINIIKTCKFNLLGDIFICDSIIKETAQKENRTLKREYSYMYLHSLLHLLGYDHIDKESTMVMHNYIENILQKNCIIK